MLSGVERRYKVLRAVVLIGALVLFASGRAFAADATRELRLQEVADNPRQVIKLAEAQMQSAPASVGNAVQLQSWRLLAVAHDEIEDNAGLRKDTEQGLARARDGRRRRGLPVLGLSRIPCEQ